jgi:uncharacterized protein YoaH (UPF0181 family)
MTFATRYDALVEALVLAVTAPTDEKAQQAVELAEKLASQGFSAGDVERAKREAEQRLNTGDHDY